MKLRVLLLQGFLLFSISIAAQQTVRSTVSANGSSTIITSSGKEYVVQQSVGQASVIGNFSSQEQVVLQGFIQPPLRVEVSNTTDNSLDAIVYPNPFNSIVNVRFSGASNAPINVRLYSILGQIIYEDELSATSEIQLDFNFLESASYLLSITQANKKFTATIIKN